MTELGDRPELLPTEKQYSVVKLDTWKAPDDEDFAYKVGELESLEEGPITAAGRGESVVVLDENGDSVSVTDGPEDPTRLRARDDGSE